MLYVARTVSLILYIRLIGAEYFCKKICCGANLPYFINRDNIKRRIREEKLDLTFFCLRKRRDGDGNHFEIVEGKRCKNSEGFRYFLQILNSIPRAVARKIRVRIPVSSYFCMIFFSLSDHYTSRLSGSLSKDTSLKFICKFLCLIISTSNSRPRFLLARRRHFYFVSYYFRLQK